VVARKLFGDEEVAEIRDAFMRQASHGRVEHLFDFDAARAEIDPLARYPRMMHPHRHEHLEVGRVARRFLLDSRIESFLAALMGERPVAAQSMFYFKPAGARGQALHQDNFYLRVRPGTCMAAWTAIDVADEQNGGLMIVPGSHECEVACPQVADPSVSFTTEYVAPPEGRQPVPIVLAPGDVLFFNGSVIHGSLPNRSVNRFRRAFICHYMPESATEIGHWYRPLLSFDGTVVEGVHDASGGGPCGTMGDAAGPH
jgi:ectoine hydroxylase-related dioxygenase (phytanoyl-CoA dioxygenase family)